MDSENSNQENAETQRTDGTSDENSSTSQPQVPIVSGPTEFQPPPSPKSQQVPPKAQKDWFDYIKLAMEGVGLVVLIAYTTFAALQWRANERAANAAKSAADTAAQALRDSNDSFNKAFSQMQIQTEALTNAAGATKREADITQDALISVQRAFVFCSSMVISRLDDPNSKVVNSFQIALNWENSGTTPAREATSHINWKVQHDPMSAIDY